MRQTDLRGEQTIGAHAGINAAKPGESLDQETGANQQDQRERYFGHDQRVADPTFPLRPAGAARARFQSSIEIDVRRLPGGDKAENDSGREGKKKRECEDCAVQLSRADPWNISGHDGHQRVGPPFRNEQSQSAAQSGKKQTLGQELANDSNAARAERTAERDFLSAPRGARQHEIGDVRIGDEQQAGDRAKQNIKRGPNVAHQFIAQRLRSGAPLCIRFRILFLQGRGDRAQLGVCLRDGHARFQARNPQQAVASTLLRVGRTSIRRRRVFRVRKVHLNRIGLDRELESFRHHPDHGVGAAVQHQDAADRVFGAIEMALPKTVAQNNFESARSSTGLLIRVSKTAAPHWPDAKHVEKFAAYRESRDALRFLFVDECQSAISILRHSRETAVLFAEIEEVRVTHRLQLGRRRRAVKIDSADGNELVRRRKRERFQEDRVDHAEDRGVRADPERERENGDDGEAGVLDQLAQSVANVG